MYLSISYLNLICKFLLTYLHYYRHIFGALIIVLINVSIFELINDLNI